MARGADFREELASPVDTGAGTSSCGARTGLASKVLVHSSCFSFRVFCSTVPTGSVSRASVLRQACWSQPTGCCSQQSDVPRRRSHTPGHVSSSGGVLAHSDRNVSSASGIGQPPRLGPIIATRRFHVKHRRRFYAPLRVRREPPTCGSGRTHSTRYQGENIWYLAGLAVGKTVNAESRGDVQWPPLRTQAYAYHCSR